MEEEHYTAYRTVHGLSAWPKKLDFISCNLKYGTVMHILDRLYEFVIWGLSLPCSRSFNIICVPFNKSVNASVILKFSTTWIFSAFPLSLWAPLYCILNRMLQQWHFNVNIGDLTWPNQCTDLLLLKITYNTT